MAYGAEYLWDFGDGNTSTEENPIHVYENPGTYTVTLDVTIDGVTVRKIRTNYVVVEEVATYTFIYVPNPDDMTYAFVYVADYPSAVPWGGTLDTTIVGTDVVFDSATQVTMAAEGTTAIGTLTKSNSDDAGVFYCEFVAGGNGSMSLQAGTFIQAFGPPFDPNTNFGGPLSSYYQSNGDLVGYSGTITGEPFEAGDIIGMVTDFNMSQTAFYKNGVLQGQVGNSNNNGSIMCGTYVLS